MKLRLPLIFLASFSFFNALWWLDKFVLSQSHEANWRYFKTSDIALGCLFGLIFAAFWVYGKPMENLKKVFGSEK